MNHQSSIERVVIDIEIRERESGNMRVMKNSADVPRELNESTLQLDDLHESSLSTTNKRPPLFSIQSDVEIQGHRTDENILEVEEEHIDTSGDAPKLLEIDLKLLWSYRKVIFLSIIISFSGFLFGFDTGVIGGIIIMKSFLKKLGHLSADGETHELESWQTGLVVSGYHIGCIIGGFTIARLANRLGRKIPILIAMIVYMTGILIQVTSSLTGKWHQFVVGRFTTGLCIGSVAVLTPMFISETAPTVIRGSCTSLYLLAIGLAILTGNIVVFVCKELFTSDAEWIVPLTIGIGAALIACVGIMLAPESARYLVSIGDYERARRSLRKVGDPDVERTLINLQQKITVDNQVSNVPFTEIFRKRYLKRVTIGACLMAFQQMSGIDYFLYYGTTLFKFAGFNDSYVTSIIIGAVALFSSLPGVYVIEKFGRKKALLVGSVSCVVCMFIYSIVGTLKIDKDATDLSVNKVPGIIMVLFTCLYIICFAPTWAATVSVLVSELYPIHIKSSAVGFATAFNWAANFFIGFCTPIITESIGYAYGFVFVGIMFSSFWFILFVVPETQGVSLEEIETLFEKSQFRPSQPYPTRI